MSAATLALRLPRDATSVPLTRLVLDAALASIGVTEDCRADVPLVLSETFTNVIRHAKPSQDYQVQVGFDEKQCTIEVTDDGPGLDDLEPIETEDPAPLPRRSTSQAGDCVSPPWSLARSRCAGGGRRVLSCGS